MDQGPTSPRLVRLGSLHSKSKTTRANDSFWHLADMTQDIAKCPQATQADIQCDDVDLDQRRTRANQTETENRSDLPRLLAKKWVCTGFGIS
jgi:hypothetical protein